MMELTFESPLPGPWQKDSAHVVDAWSAVMAEVYPGCLMKGFAESFARWGALLDTLAVVMIHGFAYQQPQPFDMPGPDGPPSMDFLHDEIGRRTGLAAAAFENKIWRGVLQRWDDELKPASIARHRELGDVDLGDLDDESLASHVGACVEHLRDMAYQHHRFNGCGIVPPADFVLHAAGWIHESPAGLFGVFDGYSPASGVLCPEILPALAALRADTGAIELLRSGGDAAAVLAALRTRVPEVDEYVRSVGFRLVAGFDTLFPTAIEVPGTIIGRLDDALDTDPDVATKRADQTASDMRQRVPEEHRAEFDELLAEGRHVYRLRDERSLYSDVSALGLLRLAMLEAGRRQAANGRLADRDHIFELNTGELAGLLSGAAEPTPEQLAERSGNRQALNAEGAPRHIGPPPPPHPKGELPPPLARLMAAFGFAVEGIIGEMDAPAGDDNTVVGIGVGSGVYEGKVHLVSSIDDLFEIEPGDVLVAPTTSEAFNSMIHLVGAIVTDHGSHQSHAAISARESGFPAVVGSVNATSRLVQGQLVRVDAAAGEVKILT
jgi:phosphohistidine swiveling domain-containing protein